MPVLVAFSSLPFCLRADAYEVATSSGAAVVHVTEPNYRPFVTVAARPELAQAVPRDGHAAGWTFYTWYDHPFVLRLSFGRNVASLGSVNSCATVVSPVVDLQPSDAEAVRGEMQRFADLALNALNALVAVVRREARLYHVFDLNREDIELTVRSDDGAILHEDPLQTILAQKEQAQTERFDLLHESEQWYLELQAMLQDADPVSLADELLMEAERALVQRFPRQAITTCHTAIETCASSLLTRGMSRRAVADEQIDYLLSTKSLTSKLDPLLGKYCGASLKRDQNTLWKSYNALNDLRNDVVHRGRRPTVADAETVIGITREVLSWLDRVRVRNRQRK